MNEQQLEYHVRKLEIAYDQSNATTRQGMQAGILTMIRSIRSKKAHLPLSLRRLEQRLQQDTEEDFFENMPV